ncbi:hypothetical protein Tco_0474129 [Tanacetum coccineum]
MPKRVNPRQANMVNDDVDMIAMVSDVAVDNGQKLYMGNSATADIKGEGDVVLKMTSEKELKLTNVLYVLEIQDEAIDSLFYTKLKLRIQLVENQGLYEVIEEVNTWLHSPSFVRNIELDMSSLLLIHLSKTVLPKGRMNRYLERIGFVPCGIMFHPAVIEGYSDANWISDIKDSRSTSGYVFTLGRGKDNKDKSEKNHSPKTAKKRRRQSRSEDGEFNLKAGEIEVVKEQGPELTSFETLFTLQKLGNKK